jgi:hypothetical protein
LDLIQRPGSASEPRVSLFRAIGERERRHLLAFGDYGRSPSAGGKYFALTEEGAVRFAGSTFNAKRRMIITRVDVPRSFLDRGFLFFDPGGAGPSVHFSEEMLADLYAIAGPPSLLDSVGPADVEGVHDQG